jgi:hypothetical protein
MNNDAFPEKGPQNELPNAGIIFPKTQNKPS